MDSMMKTYKLPLFTLQEVRDIVISLFVLSLCLTIATRNFKPDEPIVIIASIVFFAFTVGVGFVLHELGHKFAAISLGYYGQFKMWLTGLLFALFLSFTGFVFVAPGAVYIYAPRNIERWKNGLISAAGPLVNMALALCFGVLALVFPIYFGSLNIWGVSAAINTWLGLFNMIPFPPLDGSKILFWNVFVWLAMLVVFGVLFMYLHGYLAI